MSRAQSKELNCKVEHRNRLGPVSMASPGHSFSILSLALFSSLSSLLPSHSLSFLSVSRELPQGLSVLSKSSPAELFC